MNTEALQRLFGIEGKVAVITDSGGNSGCDVHPDTIARIERGELTGPGVDTERRRPLGWGTSEDIAAAVLYLVGPSGGYITGHGIVLDGGFLLS